MKSKKRNTSGFAIYWALFLIPTIVVASFVSQNQEPKKYKIELTLDEVNNTLFSLENSSAPHNVVTSLIKNIADQVNKQLAEDKKTTDSLNKKKNHP